MDFPWSDRPYRFPINIGRAPRRAVVAELRLYRLAAQLAESKYDVRLGMQDYALANHELIHQTLTEHLPVVDIVATYSTPHNEVVSRGDGFLHRKGATGIAEGLAYVPGTMRAPGFVVRQNEDATGNLDSCSHGAGRVLSRRQAKKQHPEAMPSQLGPVQLIGGEADELPHAYKNIQDVVNAQADIIHIEGIFQPRVVRMAEGRKKRRAAS